MGALLAMIRDDQPTLIEEGIGLRRHVHRPAGIILGAIMAADGVTQWGVGLTLPATAAGPAATFAVSAGWTGRSSDL
jgi:hypothetical protein